MAAPPGCAENRGTLYESPQKGTAGAGAAANAGRAAAARRALAPICRFHQRVALRSLHGLRSALPVPARQKNFFARRAGMGVGLPFIGRRRPTRHPPRRGLLTRVGTPDVAETESSSISKVQTRLLPCNGGVWRARVRPGVRLGEAETRAPATMSSVSGILCPIASFAHIGPGHCSVTSRQKLAA